MPLEAQELGPDPHEFGRSFLLRWASAIAESLNGQLPGNRYLAALHVLTWLKAEQAVADFELGPPPQYRDDGTPTGEDFPSFAAPLPDHSVPGHLAERIEVHVIDTLEGRATAAIVALVTRANRASAESERAFANHCSAQLHEGIGFAAVDIAPASPCRWLTELGAALRWDSAIGPGAANAPCAVSFRPTFRNGAAGVDVWQPKVQIGQPLPILPLGVRGGMFLRLDLEATYAETWKHGRLR